MFVRSACHPCLQLQVSPQSLHPAQQEDSVHLAWHLTHWLTVVFSPIFSLFLSYFIREPNCLLDTLWMQFVDQRCLLWAAHTAELIQGWPQSWICTASCPRTNHTDCPLIPTGNFQIDARGQDFCFDLFHYFIHEGAVSKVITTEICWWLIWYLTSLR